MMTTKTLVMTPRMMFHYVSDVGYSMLASRWQNCVTSLMLMMVIRTMMAKMITLYRTKMTMMMTRCWGDGIVLHH